MSSKTINDIFNAEEFRSFGHDLIDLLADQLNSHLHGEGKVLNWRNPAAEDKHWQQALPVKPSIDSSELLQRLRTDILPGSLAIHHPRNMGHQVATPIPVAALCDLVAALTNQAMAVYETGPTATMIERQVLRWLSELVGWKTDGAEVNGVLTTGGAQANLTALLAARQRSAVSNIWKHGVASHPPMYILASEHSHYSVSRAAGIMGLGTDTVISIATDTQGRMIPEALFQAHQQCLRNQQHILAVVANAGCTPTGSIDPLLEIGQYCQEYSLWLHVDGAHGASALLSRQYRQQLQGIELADSVVWDGHKMLYMPATVSAVLFREPENSYSAFAQDASYLFQGNNHDVETYNVSYRTLECTKRMMGLKLWATFSLYGVEGLASLVEHTFSTAGLLAKKLAEAEDFELLMQPQTNIVCFRHLCEKLLTTEALNSLQAELRNTLVQSGAFHLTQVKLNGVLWLRTTIMNPLTKESDLDALILALLSTHIN
ncbi:MAG TPA: aminotransferase class V-fold PLP-dependent enzyme [Methylophilaceae bacterium]|jgi:L-2,4-diaminobutyrate decarboxylase